MYTILEEGPGDFEPGQLDFHLGRHGSSCQLTMSFVDVIIIIIIIITTFTTQGNHQLSGKVMHEHVHTHVLARVLYTRASTCVYAHARTQ